MKKFFDFLIESNLFISLCATCLYLYFHLAYDVNFFLSTPLMVFALTYLGYHMLRLVPLLKGNPVQENFKLFYKKHKRYTLISFGFAAVFVGRGLFDLKLHEFLILGLAGIFVLLYESIFFKSFKLRNFFFIKPLVISLVWAMICTLNFPSFNTIAFMDAFIWVALLSIPFDIKDLEFDQKTGLKSFAQIYQDKIKLILTSCYVSYAAIFYYITEDEFLFVGFTWYVLALQLSKDKPWLYYLGFDGPIIFRLIFYLA